MMTPVDLWRASVCFWCRAAVFQAALAQHTLCAMGLLPRAGDETEPPRRARRPRG